MRKRVCGVTRCMALLMVFAFGLQVSIAVSDDVQERGLAVLQEGFASTEFWPSMHAAEGLSAAGHGSEIQKQLVERLEQETDDQRRCGLARELVRSGDRSHIPVLLNILSDEESTGRVHAAESLFKVAEIGDGSALRSAVNDEDPRLTLMAAAALARAGSPLALSHIRQQLSNEDPTMRMIVPWVLRQVGDPTDIPALRELADNAEDPIAASQCVHAMAQLGDAAAQERLLENLAASDPKVRVYAAEAAANLEPNDELRSLLIERLDDEDLDVRIRAAHALACLDTNGNATPKDIDIAATVYPATAENPRWSEGSIISLRDGRLLFAITRFIGGGADASHADIVARESTDGGRTWGDLRVLQENVGKRNVMSVTLRRLDPQRVADGPLGMFYLVKNGDSDLNVYLRISEDEGQTFGEPIAVTDGAGYHVMNNDRVTMLSSGRLLCPVSYTKDQSQENHYRSICFFSDDAGQHWQQGSGDVDLPKRGAMEPEVIELADGTVLMIVRSQLGRIYTARSSDGGDTWSQPEPWGPPAPEAPSTLRRIPSTGDLVLVWNDHVDPQHHHSGQRTPLSIAVSQDEGETWSQPRNLEDNPDETYAYTSLIFNKGRILLSYYVGHDGQISTKFRSLPVSWLYDAQD